MKRTQQGPTPGEAVPTWPRIGATVNPDGRGILILNGTERPVAASDLEQLRAGVIACATVLAIRLQRPVRLTVTEEAATWPLAVRPTGIVQLLGADDSLPPADGLYPHHGRCRGCGADQPVTARVCPSCDHRDPHCVTAAPRADLCTVPSTSQTTPFSEPGTT